MCNNCNTLQRSNRNIYATIELVTELFSPILHFCNMSYNDTNRFVTCINRLLSVTCNKYSENTKTGATKMSY